MAKIKPMFQVRKYQNKRQREQYYEQRRLVRGTTHDPLTGERITPLPRYIGKVRFRLSDLD